MFIECQYKSGEGIWLIDILTQIFLVIIIFFCGIVGVIVGQEILQRFAILETSPQETQKMPAKNTESLSQEVTKEIPETPDTLEIIYQKDGDNSIHYILRDNETGYEYIVVVRSSSHTATVSMTPRLGIMGHNKVNHLTN